MNCIKFSVALLLSLLVSGHAFAGQPEFECSMRVGGKIVKQGRVSETSELTMAEFPNPGQTVTVESTSFNVSRLTITTGRVFFISAPMVGSSSAHRIS